MANNLYTQAQVGSTLLRAEVALYLISKKIQNSFYYLNNPIYVNYKDLQYDIYTLFTSISYNEQFVSFDPFPDTYETGFYQLVGSLINKIKQVDFTGMFGGAINPNYQNTGSITIVITTGGTDYNVSKPIYFFDVTSVVLNDWQTTYFNSYGNYPEWQLFTGNTTDGWQEDYNPPIPAYQDNNPSSNLLSLTWTYPIPTSGYVIISGKVPGSGTGGGTPPPSSTNLPITNTSTELLSDATLNNLYPLAQWGQLILLPNVPAKYEKLDNSPTGQWDLQTYTPNT